MVPLEWKASSESGEGEERGRGGRSLRRRVTALGRVRATEGAEGKRVEGPGTEAKWEEKLVKVRRRKRDMAALSWKERV